MSRFENIKTHAEQIRQLADQAAAADLEQRSTIADLEEAIATRDTALAACGSEKAELQRLLDDCRSGGQPPPPPPPPSGDIGSPVADLAKLPILFQHDFEDRSWRSWFPDSPSPVDNWNYTGDVLDKDRKGESGTIFAPRKPGSYKEHVDPAAHVGLHGIEPQDPAHGHYVHSGKHAVHVVIDPSNPAPELIQKSGFDCWDYWSDRLHPRDIFRFAVSFWMRIPSDFPTETDLLMITQTKLGPGGRGQPWSIWVDTDGGFRIGVHQENPSAGVSATYWRGNPDRGKDVKLPLDRYFNISFRDLLRHDATGEFEAWMTPGDGEQPISLGKWTKVHTMGGGQSTPFTATQVWPSFLVYQIGKPVRETPKRVFASQASIDDVTIYDAR